MRLLFHFFLNLSRGKQIAILVLFTHFILLLSLIAHHWLTQEAQVHNRIAVHTVSLAQPKSSSPSAPTGYKQPVPKNNKPAFEAKKKKTHSVSTSKKRTVDESILKKAVEQLQMLAPDVPSKKREDLYIPSKMSLETSVITETIGDASAGERLISFLQTVLQLPEHGEVLIKLEIGPSGDLISCEILEAHSKKNSEFLKKELPKLCFPCFNDVKTFTITFRNAENL